VGKQWSQNIRIPVSFTTQRHFQVEDGIPAHGIRYVNQQTSNVNIRGCYTPLVNIPKNISRNDDKTEIYGPNPGQPTSEA
jgi:hypothetical protein